MFSLPVKPTFLLHDSRTHLVRFFFSAPTLPTVPTDDAILLDESSTDEATPAHADGEVDDNNEEEKLLSAWIDIAVESFESVGVGLAGIGIGTDAVEVGFVDV